MSYVLHAAGLLSSPLVSGQLAWWGTYGPGSWITVYANRTHTYMVIAGLRYHWMPGVEPKASPQCVWSIASRRLL